MFEKKYRRRDAALAGKVIEEDRFCRMCDYNLRGLPYGEVCPECGASIMACSSERDALCDVPLAAVRRLAIGLAIVLGSMAGMVAAPFAARPLARGEGQGWWVLVLGAASVWAIGMWLVTQPLETELGVLNGWGRRSWLRRGARVTSLAWLALAAVVMVWVMQSRSAAAAQAAAAGGNGSAVVATPAPAAAAIPGPTAAPPSPPAFPGWAVVPLLAAGMTSVPLAGMFLQRLAHWMYDLGSYQKLNWAPVGLALGAGGIVGLPFTLMMVPFRYVSIAIWIGSIAGFAWATGALTSSVMWSIRNAREDVEREVRLRTRRARAAKARQRADEAAAAEEAG